MSNDKEDFWVKEQFNPREVSRYKQAFNQLSPDQLKLVSSVLVAESKKDDSNGHLSHRDVLNICALYLFSIAEEAIHAELPVQGAELPADYADRYLEDEYDLPGWFRDW